MFENLGPLEMLLIVVIVIVLFGAKRVPEIAASVGKGIRQFKGALAGAEGSLSAAMHETPAVSRPLGAAATDSDGVRRDAPKRLMELPVAPATPAAPVNDHVGEPYGPDVE